MDDLGDSLNVPWKFFFPNWGHYCCLSWHPTYSSTIYSKLTGSDAICPIGGVSCGDILNNNYDVFYGIPLPLIGMVAYGALH
ncbi:hypothetical protein L1987_35905 [Smallanthus sonchifolius]|uniref:Uncharacterized protein n=1 Tax=Smallanthus sonchifolius TaxID=185202 RepID=A0ACB9HBY9_9ASTR|nr:hypothetical protein L1987_35905 [Smallanthus sonchifolius]